MTVSLNVYRESGDVLQLVGVLSGERGVTFWSLFEISPRIISDRSKSPTMAAQQNKQAGVDFMAIVGESAMAKGFLM